MTVESQFPKVLDEPYWQQFVLRDGPPQIRNASSDRLYDVAIIGGGIGGMSAAYHLAREGAKVVLIEADRLGSGASSRNGGAISPGTNMGKKLDGRRLSLPSQDMTELRVLGLRSYEFVAQFVAEHGIDCDLVEGGRLMLASSALQMKKLAGLADGFRRDLATTVDLLSNDDVRAITGSDFYLGALRVARSSSLNPGKLVSAMIRLVLEAGVDVMEGSPAHAVSETAGSVQIRTDGAPIRAKTVVLALNGYAAGSWGRYSASLLPISSSVIATNPVELEGWRSLPKGITVSETRRVLCYYRLSPDGTRMLFGGRASFGPMSTETAAGRLSEFLAKRVPAAARVGISHRWRGSLAFTADGLPKIGRDGNVLFFGGCNGSGVALMLYLGRAVASWVLNGSTDLPSLVLQPRPIVAKGLTAFALPVVGTLFRALDDRDDRNRAYP